MAGISIKLPLSLDPDDGYKLYKTLTEVARQNLKMLVLTAPGERIMIPEFGVGIRNYLFENMSSDVFFDLKSEIISQAETYFPYITISSVTFRQESPDTQGLSLEPSSTSHYLNLVINFSIDSEITSETLIINL